MRADDAVCTSEMTLPQAVADDCCRAIRSTAADIIGGVKVRPTSAETPTVVKNPPLTYKPSTGGASPCGARLNRSAVKARAPSSASARFLEGVPTSGSSIRPGR